MSRSSGEKKKWVLDDTLTLSQSRKTDTISALMQERRDEYGQKFTYAERLGMLEKSKQHKTMRIERFSNCCNLQFKNTTNDKIKYANYCWYSTICLACAWRRAYNIAKKLVEWLSSAWMMKKNRYMITFTMHHTSFYTIDEVVSFMLKAKEYLVKRRHNSIYSDLKDKSFFAQFEGLAFSFEITKSWPNGYHPHIHAIGCTDNDSIIKTVDLSEIYPTDLWKIASNKSAIQEWMGYVKKSMHQYYFDKHRKHIKELAEFRIWYRWNYEEALPYQIWLIKNSYRWVHIKQLDKNTITWKERYGRQGLGEVFKYSAKMSSLPTEDLLEFAYCMKMKKAKLITLVGAFRKMTWKKKKIQSPYEKAIIKPYVYNDKSNTYVRVSKDQEKRMPYRPKKDR